MSLELEEREQYKWWVNSQQDPKKFKWSHDIESGVSVAQKIMKFAQAALNKGQPYKPVKGDIWNYAKSRGFKKVFKMAECDNDTGRLIRYVYVDENRKIIDIPKGHMVVASHHKESQELAKKILEMEG